MRDDLRTVALRAFLALSAVAVGACSADGDESNGKIVLEGLPYAFPANHVLDVVHPYEGMTFIRLEPPGENFLLVKDTRADRQQVKTGRIVISKINSSRFSKVEEVIEDNIKIFCTDGRHFRCGFQVDDQGVKWSVIFDQIETPDALAIKARAQRVIAGYRAGGNSVQR